jgi:predicted RNA-binding Zn ribbon-like protein
MTSKLNPIRRGGQDIAGRFFFELSGGALAADFVNTLDERPRNRLERLGSYERLLDWARQSELVGDQQIESVAKLAAADSGAAAEVLRQAIVLREAMFATIRRSIGGQPPTPAHLQVLSRWAQAGARRRRLAGDEAGRLTWQAHVDLERLDFMLPAIVESLVEILSVGAPHAVKLCASDACDWVFVDRTRRGDRAWCDMSVCGNRAKARRHSLRARGRGALSSSRGSAL